VAQFYAGIWPLFSPGLTEPYDFLHQRKNLRVSGLLDIDGTEAAFTRLPTRDPSLRDIHGAELPNSALQGHLGGLSEDDYRNLLCLDDMTIEKGGEEITRAKGDIGRLLFSAAAGISELSEVLDRVREEADGLYRKRASTTRLAVLKKEYAEVERQIRDLDVSATQYRKLKQAADEAHAEETEVSGRRKALFGAKAELEAKLKALPVLSEIDGLDEKLEPFSSWPAQMDIDPEDLVRMLTDQAKAQSSVKKLDEETDGLRADLLEVEHHPEHLALSQELDDLDSLRSRYATAELDLDRRHTALDEILDDLRLSARDLGAPAGIDPNVLVLSPAALSELEQARERVRDDENSAKRERDELTELNEKIEAAKDAQSALSTDQSSVVDLEEIFERFSVDILAARHAAASEAVKTAIRHARAALDALTMKGHSFDDLPVCPITLEEAEALLGDVQEITRKHENYILDLEKTRAELAERSARIAQIKGMDGLIDDEEAHSLRADRDGLWKAHKASLTDKTAEGFEGAMLRVDGAMDLRLSQFADIGTLRQHEQDVAASKARADLVEQKIASLVEERDTVLEPLSAIVNEAGIGVPIRPEALVAWLRKLELAAQAKTELHRLKDEHRETFEKSKRLMDELSQHVIRDTQDFDDLVATAKTDLAAQRTHQEDLRAARSRVDDLTSDQAKRTVRLAGLEEDAAATRRHWLEQVSEVLPAGLNTELLETSLQPLHDLREREKERVVLERQVSAMEADQTQFSEKMNGLAERIGVASTDSPLSDYDELKRLSEQAIGAEDKSRALNKRINELEQAQGDTNEVLENIDLAVAEMAQLFPEGVDTGSLGALRQSVGTASGVINDRARRAELERDLLSFFDLESQEEARALLAGASQAGLRAELDEVSSDLESVEDLYKGAIEARTTAQRELRAISGDDDIARLVERKATLELELQEAALRHLELSLGHRLAETAIRRYRDEHRNSMMQATEAAFAELTNGAYSHLQTQTDGASETLLALDAGGMAKQAQDMSKGTRFQLYLALRAAAYEQLAEQGTSLPFFCDDIFETFDEERTRSACSVMERIGRRGQAIYLTHHQHVVDIAREVCGNGVQIHSIGD
jgi:uncharacterized protein YhaN